MRKGTPLLIALLFVSAILNARFVYNHYKVAQCSGPGGTVEASIDQRRKDGKIALLNNLQIDSMDVVFAGSSLTEGFSVTELFNDIHEKNRGISGGTLDDLIAIMPKVIAGRPKKIFIEIGVNDLKNNIDHVESARLAFVAGYRKMLDTLRQGSPSTSVYIEGLLPVNENYFHDQTALMNDVIDETNKNLDSLAALTHVAYIDLHSAFSQNGKMPEQYSTDGLHLNDAGYRIWFDKVKFSVLK